MYKYIDKKEMEIYNTNMRNVRLKREEGIEVYEG